jgi:hypothetical protein
MQKNQALTNQKRRKKNNRPHGNAQKKGHFLNVMKYIVNNQQTVSIEPGWKMLRGVARTLHCTANGVRVRFAAEQGEEDDLSELVRCFHELTAWKDLITEEQREKGDLKYADYVRKRNIDRTGGSVVHTSGSQASGSEVHTSPHDAGGSKVHTSLQDAGGPEIHTPPWLASHSEIGALDGSASASGVCKSQFKKLIDDGASYDDDDVVSTAYNPTEGGVSASTGVSSKAMPPIREEDDIGSDESENNALKLNPAARAKDDTTIVDLARKGKLWMHGDYKHLFRPLEHGMYLCLPTQKQLHAVGGGHVNSDHYITSMKRYILATRLFGTFDMDKIPKDPLVVPKMDEILKGYGSQLPAYDFVGQYTPANIRITNGKSKWWTYVWPAKNVLGMAVVYWDAKTGPGHFRQAKTQGGLDSEWKTFNTETAGSFPVEDL